MLKINTNFLIPLWNPKENKSKNNSFRWIIREINLKEKQKVMIFITQSKNLILLSNRIKSWRLKEQKITWKIAKKHF